MLILGIDPGSRKAGFGLIKAGEQKSVYRASGLLRYDKEKSFLQRLGLIYDSCRELVHQYRPDEIALESLIFVKSVSSLSKLAQARGAMIAAFMKTHRSKVFEYSPNLIKNAVVGHGHSSKEAVAQTLQMIFAQEIKFKTADESDALAIALCHSLLAKKGELGVQL